MKDQATKLRTLAQNMKNQIESDMYTEPRRTRVIAVTSGKGGVGKTNVALNLAICMSELGHKIILLDADMGLANIDVIMGITPEYNLFHVVTRERQINDIIIRGPEGIEIIPGGSGVFELANLSEEELKQMIHELGTLDGKSEYMILDTGAGIGNNVLSFALMADEIIVVTTPEPTSLTDAYGLIKTATSKEARGKFHIIVNRVNSEAQGLQVGQKMKTVCKTFLGKEVNVLGYIMEDQAVSNSVMKQQALVVGSPSSPASRNLRMIAQCLCEVGPLSSVKSIGIRDFFRRLTRLWIA